MRRDAPLRVNSKPGNFAVNVERSSMEALSANAFLHVLHCTNSATSVIAKNMLPFSSASLRRRRSLADCEYSPREAYADVFKQSPTTTTTATKTTTIMAASGRLRTVFHSPNEPTTTTTTAAPAPAPTSPSSSSSPDSAPAMASSSSWFRPRIQVDVCRRIEFSPVSLFVWRSFVVRKRRQGCADRRR